MDHMAHFSLNPQCGVPTTVPKNKPTLENSKEGESAIEKIDGGGAHSHTAAHHQMASVVSPLVIHLYLHRCTNVLDEPDLTFHQRKQQIISGFSLICKISPHLQFDENLNF